MTATCCSSPCPVHICAAMMPAGLCAIANKSSPEHQAQMKWAREIVSNAVVPLTDDSEHDKRRGMRYRFEQWARENVGQFSDAGYWGTGGKWIYNHNFVQMCWLAWQAACSTIDRGEKHG